MNLLIGAVGLVTVENATKIVTKQLSCALEITAGLPQTPGSQNLATFLPRGASPLIVPTAVPASFLAQQARRMSMR